MHRYIWPALALISAIMAAPGNTAGESIDFNNDIRPILSDRCFACHGPDQNSEVSQMTGLRLDERESATDYEAIVPGDSDASEMIRRILSDDPAEQMPPPEAHKAVLSEQQIELLRRWIDAGAEYSELWSLAPPRRHELPTVEKQGWPLGPIDHYVLGKIESSRSAPSPRADRRALIRRVTFDLTGLPPTLDEIKAFVEDPAETQAALEKVVDRLLASPAYGEHMAAEWLQLARFADSNGYQNDFRREMWLWRDWVIKAFNDNMPYDQFVVEQMAGDLLPEPTLSQLIATGFHRNNRTVTESGSIDEEWRVENNIDRVETTGTVFLGLTMGCARCHDHKYDAISQKEFYEFYAFFNRIDEKGVYTEQRGNVPPLVRAPSDEQTRRLADLKTRIRLAEEELESTIDSVSSSAAEQLESLLADGAGPSPIWSLPLDGSVELTSATEQSGAVVEATCPEEDPVWQDGITGQALQLTGKPKSHVELSNFSGPDLGSPFAHSLWLRPANSGGAIISQMDDGSASRGWSTDLLGDRRLKVHLIHRWPDDAIAVITKSSLITDEWNHVCVSYDGSGKAAGVAVYLNGQLAETTTEHDSLENTIASGQPLRIGRRSLGSFLKGSISSVRFFDQPMEASAVGKVIANDLLGEEGQAVDRWSKPQQKLVGRFAAWSGFDGLSFDLPNAYQMRAERKAVRAQVPTSMILRDQEKPRPTYVLMRGAYDAPDESEALTPNVPEFLPPLPQEGERSRLALAKWLTDPSHPLFSRVQVNRVWQRLFGSGLVTTPDNFGVQGAPPTHPELLDWLAVEFIESGWDIKALHKSIILSATYQQTSDVPASKYRDDPDNRLLARGARFRLPAEVIRDNALSVSGLLTTKVGGPSVKPYQPDGLWDELAGGAGEGEYILSQGDDLYRRSLYTNRKRTVPHPTLSTFDAPSFEICQAKRAITNTPLQALALLNDATYLESARGLAMRMLQEYPNDSQGRIRHGFALATAREPSNQELRVLQAAVDRHLTHYQSDADAAADVLKHGAGAVSSSVDSAELAAYTVVASVIMNLDETITRP